MMFKKVGFTGTRDGMTKQQIEWFKKYINNNIISEFHHGACKGADVQAHQIVWDAITSVLKIIVHRPINRKYEGIYRNTDCDVIELPRKDYLERDRDIVNQTDVLIAMPKSDDENRSGTLYTINYAKKQSKEVIIVYPDGRTEKI